MRRGLCPTEVKLSGPLATFLCPSNEKFLLIEGVDVSKILSGNFTEAVFSGKACNTIHFAVSYLAGGPCLTTFVGSVPQPLLDLSHNL